ncbi:MAG: hypothetical protein IKR69_02190 [Bacteroidales bacterium]|nr:hypothetical protein [Bacteroidales bacterium]
MGEFYFIIYTLDRNTVVGYAWSNAFDMADREGKIEPEIAEKTKADSMKLFEQEVEK